MTIDVGFQASPAARRHCRAAADYSHAGTRSKVIRPSCFPAFACRPLRGEVSWFARISSGRMRLKTGGCDETVRAQRTIEVLEALVGFDTTSRNSNLPLVEWVEAWLDRWGVAHERVPDKSGNKANVWATIGPAGVPGIILSGHTDVVPVDGQSWSSDPFRLTERNGRLYGRGATDMKGFDACCLAAVPDMLAAPLARPIHLALSYDEEVGCVGVRGMIARLKQAKVKPAACFVGEPTEMGVVIGHKGKRSFRVSVHGKTCHSSLAPHGVNAVEYAASLIVKIREIGERLARSGARATLSGVH